MKLLIDENISYKLARNLADLFPGSAHVRDLVLLNSDDELIWAAAAREGFAVLTKDEDFSQRAFLRDHPPKVILIDLGNCSTGQIESLVRWRVDAIRAFLDDPDVSVLALT